MASEAAIGGDNPYRAPDVGGRQQYVSPVRRPSRVAQIPVTQGSGAHGSPN